MSHRVHNLAYGRWIEVEEPSEDDEKFLRQELPFVHPTNLEDAFLPVVRPKLDLTEQYLFLSDTIPVKVPPAQRNVNFELSLILTSDTIITITPRRTAIFRREEQEKDEVADVELPNTPPMLAYRFLEAVYDLSAGAIRQVEHQLENIDHQVLDVRSPRLVQEISLLQRNIVFFTRTLNASIPYYEELEEKDVRFGKESLKEYWGDLVDKLRQQRDLLADYATILSKLAQAHGDILTYHNNHVVQLLTVASAILLPLNLIAGIYGMNVHLPLSDNPAAFVAIGGIMVAVALVLILYFKLRRWM